MLLTECILSSFVVTLFVKEKLLCSVRLYEINGNLQMLVVANKINKFSYLKFSDPVYSL